MRTAIWLYVFIFIAFFDLHAQYPILTPFAITLGATPSFIGLILGIYSITHLPGNLMAGVGVDRYGSKWFIASSLAVAGILLLLQAQVTNPWQLLIIRSFSGFVLAFLSPACLALLAKLARDHIHRGKLMAGNGLVHTLASVVSPAAGAMLVAKLGYSFSFSLLGWGLLVTGVLAGIFLKEAAPGASLPSGKRSVHGNHQPGERADTSAASASPKQDRGIPWLFFAVPLGISCSQGILFFELPLMYTGEKGVLTTGILFSLISIGSLITLSMLFLNRLSGFSRTVAGALSLAVVFFGMAVEWAVPIQVSLFLIGMAKGIAYPAMSVLLASVTSETRYGRAFSILSVASSVGAFIGPVIAGHIRDQWSPFFVAFAALMLGLSLLPIEKLRMAPVR